MTFSGRMNLILPLLRQVAEAIGVEVGVCHFDGVLSTS